jgi:hypothetical protein
MKGFVGRSWHHDDELGFSLHEVKIKISFGLSCFFDFGEMLQGNSLNGKEISNSKINLLEEVLDVHELNYCRRYNTCYCRSICQWC